MQLFNTGCHIKKTVREIQHTTFLILQVEQRSSLQLSTPFLLLSTLPLLLLLTLPIMAIKSPCIVSRPIATTCLADTSFPLKMSSGRIALKPFLTLTIAIL